MSTIQVVTSLLERIGAQDADGIGELFADRIDWLVPGNPTLPWVGPRSRRDEVPEYFRTMWSHFVPGNSVVSIEKILVDGDEAVVFAEFDQVAAPTGRRFHTAAAMRLTVAGERIVRMHLFEDTAAVSAAFQA